jgi:hypothetical protein
LTTPEYFRTFFIIQLTPLIKPWYLYLKSIRKGLNMEYEQEYIDELDELEDDGLEELTDDELEEEATGSTRDGDRAVGPAAIFVAIVEHAVEDYHALVEKGVLEAGDFVRHTKGPKKGQIKFNGFTKKDKSYIARSYKTANSIQQLLNWMTDGSMQNCLEIADARTHAHYILKSIGFARKHYVG